MGQCVTHLDRLALHHFEWSSDSGTVVRQTWTGQGTIPESLPSAWHHCALRLALPNSVAKLAGKWSAMEWIFANLFAFYAEIARTFANAGWASEESSCIWLISLGFACCWKSAVAPVEAKKDKSCWWVICAVFAWFCRRSPLPVELFPESFLSWKLLLFIHFLA